MYALMCLPMLLLTEWFIILITGTLLLHTMHRLKFIQRALENERE
jgi:hypothetical protein